MEAIYEKVIKQVSQGVQCVVDFKNRTLALGGKNVDIAKCELGVKQYNNIDEWLDEVENLYDDYKYSRPSQQTIKRDRKTKFRALTMAQLIDELGHDALNNPTPRNVAQAKLEAFILLSLINGSFKPEELFAKDWFYQGADKSFIIRKDWF